MLRLNTTKTSMDSPGLRASGQPDSPLRASEGNNTDMISSIISDDHIMKLYKQRKTLLESQISNNLSRRNTLVNLAG